MQCYIATHANRVEQRLWCMPWNIANGNDCIEWLIEHIYFGSFRNVKLPDAISGLFIRYFVSITIRLLKLNLLISARPLECWSNCFSIIRMV